MVDDIEYEITHVVRGNDHRPNEELHRELTEALGGKPPEYVHHGLVLGPEGGKLSKRDAMSSVADLRDAGIPAEAVRAYLDELGLPKHDVQLDLTRIRRLAVEAIGAMSDDDLAARVGVSPALVPAVRGARDLEEAREYARQILEPEPVQLPAEARPTLDLLVFARRRDCRGRARRCREARADARLALAQRRRQARAEGEVAGEGAGDRAHPRRAQAARAGRIAARFVRRPGRRRRGDRRVVRRPACHRSAVVEPAVRPMRSASSSFST